jgi:hypothetical protein
MESGDIPRLVDIERESFPAMWPQTTYKREHSNHLARYLVLVEAQRADASSPGPLGRRSLGWRESLRRLLRLEPPTESTAELTPGFAGLWLMMGEARVVTLALRESRRRRGLNGSGVHACRCQRMGVCPGSCPRRARAARWARGTSRRGGGRRRARTG